MSSRFFRGMRRAFTLVEIMIVVLIIGILLSIAIPNFIRARESSRGKACQANLHQIDGAKEQWGLANKKTATDTAPASTDLGGTYIKTFPACPSNGTYTIGQLGVNPTCTIGTNGTADTFDDHVLP